MKKLSLILSLLVGLTNQLLAQDQWRSYTNKDNVQAMAVQGDKIWIGTTGGVLVRNTNGETVAEYTTTDGLGGNSVLAMTADNIGNLWFGTKDGGVHSFSGFMVWASLLAFIQSTSGDTFVSVNPEKCVNSSR